MTQFRSVALMLALGLLGAGIAAGGLLVSDSAPQGYEDLIAKDLPVLIVAAGVGFVGGMLVALLWSGLQRQFTPSAPRS